MAVGARATTVSPRVSCFRDTCNVYVLRSGSEAILVDFGDGDVLDHLPELGVEHVTDVLLTHHHRDQLGGLARAVETGIRVWAPPLEAHLIADAEGHRRRRKTRNDYDLREDRFSLLESVPVTGTVAEYRTGRYGAFDVFALPTPGHTVGSLTYLVEIDERLLAFSGDLVHEGGKVWSLAATQWSYGGTEGQVATVVSCTVLAGREPDVLLPSHGAPIDDPRASLELTAGRVQELLDLRRLEPWDVAGMTRSPWEEVAPGFLRNRAAFASSYALLSETGAALLFDFGYDVATGLTPSTELGAKRPLLFALEALRRDHRVERVEAVLTTHYHDDHVAGLELLRAVEGAEVWAPENVAPILEHPERYDLPCLWWEPIAVDRQVALGQAIRWHEHEIRAHPLPGHTLYAAAFEVVAGGTRILVVGDQQSNDHGRSLLNYQYRNRFLPEHYLRSAELYRLVRPDVLVSGHWPPQRVTGELLDALAADAARVAELHRELLPDGGPGVEGFLARIEPYRSRVAAGASLELAVSVRNPFDRGDAASVRLVVPSGWEAPPAREIELDGDGEAVVRFTVTAGPSSGAVAADVTVGGVRYGQQAEALVEVGP
jgi:glyoxylase-like metal-dependent hydrolase (beta-lactamase superfamily II)